MSASNLIVKTEKAYFIFEFEVNKTAEEAQTRIEKYRSTFSYRERDVFCVGINFQRVNAERIVCNWIVNLYSENDVLKKAFSREELVYSINQPRVVTVKREPVHNYYDIYEELGSGGFAMVYKCVEKRTGKIWAAKFITLKMEGVEDYVREEIDVMNQLHHPRLLSLHDAFEYNNQIVLIVEL